MSNSKHHVLLAFLIVAAAAVTAGVMIFLRPSVPTKKPPVPVPLVDIMVVHPVDHTLKIESYGTVQPALVSHLVAEVSGVIEWVSPKFVTGGFFKKGDLLLRVEDDDYKFGVAGAKAQLTRARLALAQERQAAETAAREWEVIGTGTPEPLALHKPQLANAQAQVESARAALEKAEKDLARTRIIAPFDGRIQKKYVDWGQFINRGIRMADIYATNKMEVRMPISDRQLALVTLPLRTPGKQPRVRFHADIAGETHQWFGRIVRTEGLMDPQTRMLFAVGEVDDPFGLNTDSPSDPLLPGMYVEAEIEGNTLHNVFILPRSAVRDTDKVYLVDENNKLHIRKINILKSGENVIVKSGLSPGDRVCLSYLSVVTDGMTVKPVEAPRSEATEISGTTTAYPPEVTYGTND